MTAYDSNLVLQGRVDAATERSLRFLQTLEAGNGLPEGVLRFSHAHDADAAPGMLLPATYNGIMCLDLLGALDTWTEARRQALADWLLSHRREDGIFRIRGMKDGAIYKKPDTAETWRYIDFHVTNYTLGALEALVPNVAAELDFARPWLDPQTLKAWLADRDLRDPWQEGNNIVNLASFLLLLEKEGGDTRERADAAIRILFNWHDQLQEPATGFWGVGQMLGGEALLHAMAGSMHNFHLWYARNRPLAYQERAVDYVLGRDPSWHSACIDVDEVDLLVHAAGVSDYRRSEIQYWLQCKLTALLDHQNEDGGFADTFDQTWRQDGWIEGPVEAPGTSTTFATWFRWIAIAMIDEHFWPGRRSWRFRKMIGIGYRRPFTHD